MLQPTRTGSVSGLSSVLVIVLAGGDQVVESGVGLGIELGVVAGRIGVLDLQRLAGAITSTWGSKRHLELSSTTGSLADASYSGATSTPSVQQPNQGVLQPAARADLQRFVGPVGTADGLILVDDQRLELGRLAVVDDPAGDCAPFGRVGRKAQAGDDKASKPSNCGV